MATDFDIVIYGASGFTGSLAARYLTQKGVGESLRIAIAGRNADKLLKVQEQCQIKPAILIADCNDTPRIENLVKSTHVILSFAGPFALYGEPLIAACARFGRSYLDITGESPFIRRMIERYDELAKQNGARLIPFSGFDSTPADVAVFLALDAAKSRGLTLDEMSFYYQMRGGLNGGTLASGLNMAEQQQLAELFNPNCLILDSAWPKPDRSLPQGPSYEPILRRWSVPFVMDPINRAVVRRSAWLRQQSGSHEAEFRYEERLLMGPRLGLMQAGLFTGAFAGFGALQKSTSGRRILRRLGPKPGQGPSEQTRQHGYFKGQLVARSHGLGKLIIRMEREGDPGNEVTVCLACEQAILAAKNAFADKSKGFLTSTTAFGSHLPERLKQAGFRIDTKWL